MEPAGPPLYRYHRIGSLTDRFDLEVGFPVGAPIDGDDRVTAGTLPEGRYLVLDTAGIRTRSPARTLPWSTGPTPMTWR